MNKTAKATNNLPAIIPDDQVAKFEQMSGYLKLVSQAPPAKMVVEDSKGIKDIPIGNVETLLTTIFQDWYVEVLGQPQTMFNSVTVTARLHYKIPVSGEWRYQDGVGAVPVQTRSGAGAADMANILNDAVQKALPAAKSYAIKDAADHIGPVFGRDLNRKHTSKFTDLYAKSDSDKIKDRIMKSKTIAAVEKIIAAMPAEDQALYIDAANERCQEIRDGRNRT